MKIHSLKPTEREEWARLRAALWPDCPPERHREEMAEILQNPDQEAVFVSARPDGRLNGFAEARIRAHAPGCKTRLIGYLEGWYVEPKVRRQGIGKALVSAAEEWARSKGCQEMASDAQADNRLSRSIHKRLGYKEVSKLVHFRKELCQRQR